MWLKDSLVKVLRGHKGLSLHVLSFEVFRMTLVREVVWYVRHNINLGVLKDYLGSLEVNVCTFSSRITWVSLLIALVWEIAIFCMCCMLMYFMCVCVALWEILWIV